MNKFLLVSFAVMTAAMLSGCSSDGDGGNDGGKPNEIAVTQEQQAVVESYACFSFDLLDEVVGMAEEGENIIVSPWGAANILSMLANGAGTDVRSLARNLDEDDFDTDVAAGKFDWYEVPVSMPRFEADCKLDIYDVFASMGLKSGWTGIADGMNGAGPGVLFIKQASKIVVDEDGATAASLTHTSMDTALPFPVAKPFVVDRPFIYLLRENSTGIMLQMGVIVRL